MIANISTANRNEAEALDGWMHNIHVPTDEHVYVAVLWAVELFPPTELPALERALKRNGWEKRGPIPSEVGNREALANARAGHGMTWWRRADLVGRRSTWYMPGSIRAELPADFGAVELRAIQIGESLTAIVAEFTLHDETSQALDKEWHRPHEPFVLREKGRQPQSLDRHWGALWQTQQERTWLHQAARRWLSDRLPGNFAHQQKPQLVLDLLLLDKFDPTSSSLGDSREAQIRQQEAFRALGLDAYGFSQLTSERLPKLVLTPVEHRMHQGMGEAPTWALWGQRNAVVAAVGEETLDAYGGGANLNREIAARLVDDMYNVLVMLAVSELLSVAEKHYAAIRDQAGI